MTTLREAAQQALEAYDKHEPLAFVMEALRAALEEPAQEPVGVLRTLVQIHPDGTETWREDPVWIAPPQRKPLSDDEITQAMFRADAIFTGPMQFRFAREIERAHGIKP